MNPQLTREWAQAQDKVFSGEDSPGSCFQYEALREAQELICPTNLTIRQHVIMAAFWGPRLGWLHVDKAAKQFDALEHNLYWTEGYSYFMYTKVALDWARARGIEFPLLPGIRLRAIEANYMDLVAPDGTIPLPEVNTEMHALGIDLPQSVTNDSYICHRWNSGAYLLICIDPDLHEPRTNLHVKPQCGYFAFGKKSGMCLLDAYTGEEIICEPSDRFAWRVHCRPYTGFDATSLPNEDGLLDLLPPGAVLPTWRVKPPEITVKRGDNWVEIRWKNPWMWARTRRITWSSSEIRCEDKWGAFGNEVRRLEV